jgi:hypothetical protein
MTNQPLFDPTLEEIHVQIAKFRFDRKKHTIKLYY